jgi:hypothetical protein
VAGDIAGVAVRESSCALVAPGVEVGETMGDIADYMIDEFIAQRFEDKAEKKQNRRQAAGEFENAKTVAFAGGLILRKVDDTLYQLWPRGKRTWLLNVYPGNRRLWFDRNFAKPPYLRLSDEWGLIDVVQAAIEALRKEKPDVRDHSSPVELRGPDSGPCARFGTPARGVIGIGPVD